jgi:hypothetical protein
MKKLKSILCFIRGRHLMIFDSGTRTDSSRVIRSRCSTCGHPEEEVIPIGVV